MGSYPEVQIHLFKIMDVIHQSSKGDSQQCFKGLVNIHWGVGTGAKSDRTHTFFC